MVLTNSSKKPLKIDTYNVVKQIGKGGFSTVYHVRDSSREYALKLLKNSYNLARIKKHFEVLKLLNTSELFFKTYATKKLLDRYYVLMEYTDEKNLRRQVRQNVLSENEALSFLENILKSFRFFQENGIIHGDIKAENILKKDDKYYIIDYDVVLLSATSKTLHIKGDDDYTAPEIYRGYQTQVSDIYSLGCTLYELLTNEHIYRFDDSYVFSQKMFAHLYLQAFSHKNISPKMMYLIQRMTDKNPDTRADIDEIKVILNDEIDFTPAEVQNITLPQLESERYKKMAKEGVVYAQNVLGLMYEKGYDTSKDIQNAFAWYKKAASQGLAKAEFNLGLCYLYAKGCEQDYERAKAYFTQASKQEHNRSFFYLAKMYEEALGVQKDLKKTREYYLKSAEYGYKPAYKKLFQKQNKRDSITYMKL